MRHLVSASPTARPRAPGAAAAPPCRVRLADGRVFDGPLAIERHRAIQLGMLHNDTDGLVELTPGTRSPDGTLAVDRRHRHEHYLPGGARGHPDWLTGLLAHAERITTGAYARNRTGPAREEAFLGVAPRTRARGTKDAVHATRWLWVDVDGQDRLDALWTLLAQRPCHLLVESGGSGGAHAYWKLDAPLQPVIIGSDGALLEPIERAHERLIHALGVDENGHPDVADPRCAERSRVMRLAGTVNHKRGAYARVIQADLALAPYRLEELIGGLPEPPSAMRAPRPRRSDGRSEDPYKRIAPREYFARLAGISVPATGLVRCPVPDHDDQHPSCSVGRAPEEGWCCHSSACGARGAIYDLASVLDRGPWGAALRGESFSRAHARVAAAFAGADPTPPRPQVIASGPADGDPRDDTASDALWLVRVHDDVDPRIAGHAGGHYTSPPQPIAEALALIGLLLEGSVEAGDDRRSWTHPIAGGRRTIALESARSR